MRTIAVLLAGILTATAVAQQVYNKTPDWISADTQVSTGAALTDINGDGWLDLVVANGNDIYEQHLVVYHNRGDGTLPSVPDWQSADNVYNGHLDVADVNGDGWPDVAVATLGEFSTTGPIARLYLNNAGTLFTTPVWLAHVDGNAFGVAFGDVNNDGRPDLAVATGWAYSPQKSYHNYVYLNVGGTLEKTASWASDDTDHLQGVLWVDGNDDGWLDLVGCAGRNRSRIYRNLGGTLETTASWHTSDVSSEDSIMATTGDVNGDGCRDLFLTDNTQIGGSGRFRQYDGLTVGMFATKYGWSYYDGYGSAIALADVDADGQLDLATGAWWDYTRLFFNTGTGLPPSPSWNSGATSVVEKIVFGDLDNKALHTMVEFFPVGPGATHLFYLARQPVQEIVTVRRNGVVLQPSQYTFNREQGWVVIGPEQGDVEIEYAYAGRLDMAVTNWDSSKGNYVYYNQLPPPGDLNCDGKVDFDDIDPFVLALGGEPGYKAQYPNCRWLNADCNFDGQVDFDDIDPFVAVLGGD